jgi:hypothetical protein
MIRFVLSHILIFTFWMAALWCPAADLVLVTPESVSAQAIRKWKTEGFSGIVLFLDETNVAGMKPAVEHLQAASVPFHYWIEVGRNSRMAEAHPRWMASIGMHDDWRKRFPNIAAPETGEVAKAFPWVSINYKEAFDAHLTRVKQLLVAAPSNHVGLLLNDLQAGPSSCGCGNVQCRWATDYHVARTGSALGDDAAARFVREIEKIAGAHHVIPAWTTECEHQDLPAEKRPDGKSTGLCGHVGCAVGTCPKDFTKQWNNLVSERTNAIALLALPYQFGRTNAAFTHGVAWVAQPAAYLDETLPKNGGARFPHERLWLVVEGSGPDEELAARKAALQTGAANIIVARVRLDQSYEPRVIPW